MNIIFALAKIQRRCKTFECWGWQWGFFEPNALLKFQIIVNNFCNQVRRTNESRQKYDLQALQARTLLRNFS